MRLQLVLWVLLIGLVDLNNPRTANAAVAINVTNQGMTGWLFNGAAPPVPLTLTRGQTYMFVVNASGHPFYITSVPGIAPLVPLVDSGLSGNGTPNGVGTVTFTPSSTTPASVSYQCSLHAMMTGSINVVAAAPVPAVGAWGLLAFGVLLMAAGTVAVRRRRRG